ncbi:MAG: DUF4142 domain-containing protein [Scytonema hyalinum WJT4-NPBG1]|jgi:putative membrane protein|nr:DUF4142 domain-containing protein [Scytonema hyalinum WJT4-NPBG1]
MVSDKRSLKKHIGNSILTAFACISSVFIGCDFNSPSQPILAQNTLETNSLFGNTTFVAETTNSRPSLSVLDQEFMTKVAQSNMIAIQTSELALQKSINLSVKQFAQQMIQAHEGSSKQLMRIAKVKGFNLPKDVGSENESFLKTLKQVPSSNFNRAYMQGQVRVHSKTQTELQKYLQQGQDPDLKAFADKILPVVAKHREKAQKIVRQL